MKQPSVQKSSAWFWVGFTLLLLSAFLWLILILATVSDSGGIGDAIVIGVIITAIPIGIGTYGIWRGRKPKTGKWWAWTAVRFLSVLAIAGGIIGWIVTEKTWMFILSVLGIVLGVLLWKFASKRWERYD